MLKGISHIAIAVNDLDAACAFYHDVMGGEIVNRHVMSQQKVEIAFVKFPGQTKIELLTPTESDSPVGRFLTKYGPGLHHICFHTEDIAAQAATLERHGVQVIDKTPRAGAEFDRIVFLHPSSTLDTLIELSEPLKVDS